MNTDDLKYYGECIKEVRKISQMTQAQLAEAAKVRIATISEIESGKCNFKISTLMKISEALKYEIEISFVPINNN